MLAALSARCPECSLPTVVACTRAVHADSVFGDRTTRSAALQFNYYGEVLEDGIIQKVPADMDQPQRNMPRSLPRPQEEDDEDEEHQE